MEAEQIYACPKCRYFFTTVVKTTNNCKECGTEFARVPISYKAYASLPKEQKEKVKAEFFDTGNIEHTQQQFEDRPVAKPQAANSQSSTEQPKQNHLEDVPQKVVVTNEVTVSMGEGEQLPRYSGWVTFLNTVCNILIGLCVAGGILYAFSADNIGVGIFVCAFVTLIACLTVAATKIFMEIAVDIREIRNKLNL